MLYLEKKNPYKLGLFRVTVHNLPSLPRISPYTYTHLTSLTHTQYSVSEKSQNVRRLEAQRNELNAKVRLLREELQLLQEQGSHVGEVVKAMDKKKVLVKV